MKWKFASHKYAAHKYASGRFAGAGVDSTFPVYDGYLTRPATDSPGFMACDPGRSSVYLRNQNQSSTGDQYIQG